MARDFLQSMAQYDDAVLVRMCVRDPEVFGVVMARYTDRLLRYIHRLSRVTHEEAEDILQESFIKAYQNINDFDTALSFSSWMYRIVYTTTISAWRHKRVRPHGNMIDVDPHDLAQIPAERENPLHTVARADEQARVLEVLACMDEKYRSVLILRYLEDKQYDEMSDILEKPMGTIAVLLNRAKKQFRKEADRMGIHYEFHEKNHP